MLEAYPSVAGFRAARLHRDRRHVDPPLGDPRRDALPELSLDRPPARRLGLGDDPDHLGGVGDLHDSQHLRVLAEPALERLLRGELLEQLLQDDADATGFLRDGHPDVDDRPAPSARLVSDDDPAGERGGSGPAATTASLGVVAGLLGPAAVPPDVPADDQTDHDRDRDGDRDRDREPDPPVPRVAGGVLGEERYAKASSSARRTSTFTRWRRYSADPNASSGGAVPSSPRAAADAAAAHPSTASSPPP